MVISKHILFVLTVSSLVATQAYAAAPGGNVSDPNQVAASTVGLDGSSLDFSTLWNTDPNQVSSVVSTAKSQAQASVSALTSAVGNVQDANEQKTLNDRITLLQTQMSNIDTINSLYTQGAQLTQAINTLVNAAANATDDQMAGILQQLNTKQSQLAQVQTNLTNAVSSIKTEANTIASTQSNVDKAVTDASNAQNNANNNGNVVDNSNNNGNVVDNGNGGNGNVVDADAEKKATADADAAAAATARTVALSTRSSAMDTLRSAGAGDSGASTRVTELKGSGTPTSSRTRIGYVRSSS